MAMTAQLYGHSDAEGRGLIGSRLLKFGPLADITLVLAARIVPGALSLLAVPFYVRTLGAENYGAIGFFLAIQMVVGMMDFGLSTAVLREASWLKGRGAPPNRLLALLRTFEIPFWVIACTITAIGLLVGEPLLRAIFVIDPSRVGVGFPTSAFVFAAASARFPFSVYFAYLSGLGYAGRANMLVLILDTLRTVGTVLLLLISPTLFAFFACQASAAIATSLLGAWFARRSFGPSLEAAAIDWSLYKDLRTLMIGTGLYYVVHGLAYNLDKVFLPRFLSAADYGHYVAIGQLAVIAFWVPHGIWWAQNPRLLAALAAGDTRRSLDAFALTATLMSATCTAVILLVYLAAPAFVRIWRDATSVEGFAQVLILLILGNAAYALTHLAMSIQQAAKTMSPLLFVYAVSALVIPMAAVLVLGTFTATSGASVWCALYVVSFLGGMTAYRKHAPAFLSIWAYRVVMPFLLTVLLGTAASQWTHALSESSQIVAGGCMAALAFFANIAIDQQARTSFWRLVSSRAAV